MMKTVSFGLLALLTWLLVGCTKESVPPAPAPAPPPTPVPVPVPGKITSKEYIEALLFVPGSNFQILTDKPATFSSSNPLISLSPSGVVSRITSGEVVPIDVTWNESGTKTRIYALGATDDSHDQPYARYHGVPDLNPYFQV